MSSRPALRSAAERLEAPHPPSRVELILLGLSVTPLLRWLVVRLAVPAGQISRRFCDCCGVEVSPVGPGWAALLPSGRCGRCWQRVGAPPYLLELCTAVVVTIVVLAAPTIPVMLAGLWWAGCAVALVFIDAQVHRLPNAITLPAAAGVFALLAVDAAVTDQWEHVLSAVICSAVTTTVFVSMELVLANRGLGLGDAKLILSVTALLGWWDWGAAFGAVFLGFLAAGLVGAVLLAARRVRRGAHIAMGPFFIAGAVVMLALVAWAPPE